jgi:NAD(P)-dependent dehydrogenase (short-subunit alcohol dehydrogenase family)
VTILASGKRELADRPMANQLNPLFDLTGRVALITGGSRGLGLAMARAFAAAGADIVISSRHEDELRTALQEVQSAGPGRAAYVVADMTNRDDVQNLACKAMSQMGRVDILVNNAGSNVPQAIDEIRDEDWDRFLELNLTSCMSLTRALAPQMKERRWGRVIHISSIMGLASTQGRNVYSASKSALIGLCKASALDLGGYNITVNCLAPGPFLTDLPGKVLTEAQKAALAQRTALGRWADPRELAGPALLLASDAGSYITGTVLIVDGGTLCKIL